MKQSAYDNKMNNNEKFLNDEIILGILLQLDFDDFNKACKTNHQFMRVCKENKRRLLKYFIHKEFGECIKITSKISDKFWGELLIEYAGAQEMILNMSKHDFYKQALTRKGYDLTHCARFAHFRGLKLISKYFFSDITTDF